MANIIRTSEELLAFVTSEIIGGQNLSIRGVARCCGVGHKSIIRNGAFGNAKLAQTMAEHGFNVAELVRNGFPPQAAWLAIEHYAYDSKAEALMAKRIARTFGSVGIVAILESIRGETTTDLQLLAHEKYASLEDDATSDRVLSSNLYVLATEDGLYVKIGISQNPARRLASLQTGCPSPLALVITKSLKSAREVEALLHSKLADFKIQGEWFDSSVLSLVDWGCLT